MNRLSRFRTCLVALAAVLMLPLLGCGSDPETPTQGKVSLLLTDAPGDFKQATVTITQIYLQGEGGTGRVVLSDTKTTTNLLTLVNKTQELVKDAVVPTGTYSELRFVISGGFIEVENADGTTSIYASSPTYEGLPAGARVAGDLQMPSLAQSGLKVKLPGDEKLTITGEQKILLVDFDVAQSFGHDAGQGKKWVMHPVVEATDIVASGSVKVTLNVGAGVTLPTVNDAQVTLADFKATLTNAAGSREELALVDANGDGVFEAHFKFLIPGTFSVGIASPEGVSFTVTPAQPATHTITSGQDGTFAFTLTGAASTDVQ
jgi:hypothetical protein